MNTENVAQVDLAAVELATNPEARCACIIIGDRSCSMTGQKISQLNAGLKLFRDALLADSLARLRVEPALVTFDGDVRVDVPFCSPDNFQPPTLVAGGGTSMGAGITTSLDELDARRAVYKSSGLSFYRPWAILLTDGEPTDDITEASRRIKAAESARRLEFFSVGVQGANMAKLAQLSLRPPVMLDGLRFCDFFKWLSVSLNSVAASRIGEQVLLPPLDWNKVV